MDHPNTHALYRYWEELRAGRDAPSRSEVDPRRISGALETMFILESLDSGQLRFRLAGTRLCEWLGMEPRGCVAEAVMARGHERELADLGRRVLNTPGVGVMRVRALDGAETDWSGEALLLPLRSEMGDMARIIGCVNLESADRGAGPKPPLRLRALGSRLEPIEISPTLERQRTRLHADPLGARLMPRLGGALSSPDQTGGRSEGFAEPQAPRLSGRPSADAWPRLKAIEGNPDAARDGVGSGRKGRPNLRIVKD